MKTLVVYDSFFGNTEKIARTIAEVLSDGNETKAIRATEIQPEDWENISLLVIGSPTRRFTASPATKKVISDIPRKKMKTLKVAAFDTRISIEDIHSKFLRRLIDFFGYAAEPLAKRIARKGGMLITAPVGFYVNDTEGPLKEGETDRAKNWAKELKELLS